MSEREFDDFLREVAEGLGRRAAGERVTGELRDHLEEQFAEFVAEGIGRDEAVRRALAEFGDGRTLAANLSAARGGVRRRRAMRWSGGAAVALATALTLLWAMWPQDARVPLGGRVEAQGEAAAPGGVEAGLTDDERKIEAALAKRVTADFVETPLADVADYLAEHCGVAIAIDRRALSDVGIGVDKPVTIKFVESPLGAVLDWIATQDGDLAWTYRDESLEFTTWEAAERDVQTRLYPIHDLTGAADGRLAEMLTEAVQETTTSRGGWAPQGGSGIAAAKGGSLVVTHDWRTQREIRRWLDAVRRATAANGAGERAVRETPSFPAPTEAERKFATALRHATDVDFVELPLSDVVEFLATQHAVPIRLDRRALEEAAIGADSPVTLRARNATLQSALNRVARSLDLVWTRDADALVITSRERRDERPVMRAYPVGDLLEGYDVDSREDVLESLAAFLTANVRGGDATWQADGGVGVVKPLAAQQVLVVSQTDEAHRQVEKLLLDLRATRKPGPAAASRDVTLRVYVVQSEDLETPDMEELVGMIKTLVDPDSWDKDPRAYVRHVGRRLVVRQTETTQRKVHKLLSQQLQLQVTNTADGGGARGGGGGGGFF